MKTIVSYLFFFILLTFSLNAFAQMRTISGKIVDEKGNPLAIATIEVKGGSTTLTEDDGTFSIEAPQGNDTLIISAVGYQNKEYYVSANESSISITLSTDEENTTINGVEVYGIKVGGGKGPTAVTTVTAEQIEKRPITNVIKALEGQPGIQITSGGGQPGATPDFIMRGMGSLSASNSPLIVVDGTPFNGELNEINPGDVASISLLKDATASSLYGAKGANGVILITTKRGKGNNGKPTVNFDAQVGFVNNLLPLYKTVNAKEYLETSYQMLKNYYIMNAGYPDTIMKNPQVKDIFWQGLMGGYNPYGNPDAMDFTTGKIDPNAQLLYNENWFDNLRRTGVRQQYNFSIANGNDDYDYYFSVGYNEDQGILTNSNYNRITTKLNVNSKVTKWLRSGINISFNYDEQDNLPAGLDYNSTYVNPFFSAQSIAPIFPVYLHDTNGQRVYGKDGESLYDFGLNPEYGQQRPFAQNVNPVASQSLDMIRYRTFSGRGIGYLEATFLKDFTFKTDLSVDIEDYNQKNFYNPVYGQFAASGGAITQYLGNNFAYTWRQLLTWKPSFGLFSNNDHNLAVTVDHENFMNTLHPYVTSSSGFALPGYSELSAAAVAGGNSGNADTLTSESYLALADYNYKGKYYLQGSIRFDGSSRFSSQSRWGSFYSVGAAWTVSEEHFMDDLRSWLEVLKLRASYGIQGNENLGDGNYYSWMERYYYSPNNTHPGYLFNSWGNPDLQWESQYMFNVGADIGLFKNRLSLSLEYYRRGSKDLLYVQPYAPSVGIGGIQANVGNMQNTGVEVTLKGQVINKRNFSWDMQLNLSHNKNKVTKMQDQDTIQGGGSIMTKGLSLNSFFMPEYAGVDDSGRALYNIKYTRDPATGELVAAGEGATTTDYSIAELSQNEKLFGNAFRAIDGSFTNNIQYKNFDFSVMINFGLGGKFYDNTYAGLMAPSNGAYGQTWSTDILNAWTIDNPNSDIPRVDLSDVGRISNRFLISASYMKIQNINLGYTLPVRWYEKSGFTKLRVYVSMDNVYLLAARKGLDIQQSFSGSSSFIYFPYRSVMFGIKATL